MGLFVLHDVGEDMPLSGKDHVLELLHDLSNPVRKRIIEALSERGQATFSDLLIFCDLDIYYQKGLLDYHLKELCRSRIVEKAGMGYILSSMGKTVAEFLGSLESEYLRLFTAREPEKGGEIVKLSIGTLEERDAYERHLLPLLKKAVRQVRDIQDMDIGLPVDLPHYSGIVRFDVQLLPYELKTEARILGELKMIHKKLDNLEGKLKN